jgi:NAD(P)-dependent dehydrogenase (short-subunit alcohol dehydrogenase family)
VNPFELNGKHLLITGASSGIGKSTAVLCSKLGGHVITVGRNLQRLEETMSLLSGEGHQMLQCDLSDETQLQIMASSIGKLDGIVYCAGTIQTCITRNLTKEFCQGIFDANFYSAVGLNTLLLSQRKINKKASLVFVSSLSAFNCAEYGNAAYGASKGALAAYARVLALELSTRGCRVNIVSPGMVRTPLLQKFDVSDEQFVEDEKKYPLGYGQPEDIANAIVYLLSDASKWMTGTNLIIDGGLTLR